MNYITQAVFTIGVLGLGILGTTLLIRLKPEAPKHESLIIIPPVLTYITTAFNQAVEISSQGSVQAFRESELSSEIDGLVISLNDHFLSGRSVKQGDILINLDPEPYQLAIKSAEARLAQAKLSALQEQARAEQAQTDWVNVGRSLTDASDLALRKPQIAVAHANISAAESDVQLAQRRLNQCTIRAPFDGFIESAMVGVGQSVRAGTSLGHIIDSQRVEVELPILNQDMEFLQLPRVGFSSEVQLEAQIGQQLHKWPATLTRVIPRIGKQNQQFICIAEVEQPFNGSIPLLPDLFISATIIGTIPQDTIEIPRDCVHEGNYVWVLDQDSKLQKRSVHIIRYNKSAISINYPNETVLVSKSLNIGDELCLTKLPVMANDMPVGKIPPPSAQQVE